ncbi:MAG TPA: hypothetical protein VLF20_01320 [Patescibacteria group bacterium]|nr:hypothetical protein [Patescibacteria group bacterium]
MTELKSSRVYYIDGGNETVGFVSQTPLTGRGMRGRSGVVLNSQVAGQEGFVHTKTVLDRWHGIKVPFFARRLNFAVRRSKNIVRKASRG